MRHAFVFGYGSLVNRRTHAYPAAHAARIGGWRRVWRHTRTRAVPYLTAVPDRASEIDGMIAEVPHADWPALDHRERAYDRARADAVTHPLEADTEVHIYWVPADKHLPSTRAHPILMSYLDVVVQGYLHEFGEPGVARFFETTGGWDAPVRDDRASPRYARHQPLSAFERGMVAAHLAALGVDVVKDTGDG